MATPTKGRTLLSDEAGIAEVGNRSETGWFGAIRSWENLAREAPIVVVKKKSDGAAYYVAFAPPHSPAVAWLSDSGLEYDRLLSAGETVAEPVTSLGDDFGNTTNPFVAALGPRSAGPLSIAWEVPELPEEWDDSDVPSALAVQGARDFVAAVDEGARGSLFVFPAVDGGLSVESQVGSRRWTLEVESDGQHHVVVVDPERGRPSGTEGIERDDALRSFEEFRRG